MTVDHTTPTPLPILQVDRSQTPTAAQAIEFPAYPVLQPAFGPVPSNAQAIEFPAYPKLAPFSKAGGSQAPPLPTTGIIYPRPRNVFSG